MDAQLGLDVSGLGSGAKMEILSVGELEMKINNVYSHENRQGNDEVLFNLPTSCESHEKWDKTDLKCINKIIEALASSSKCAADSL